MNWPKFKEGQIVRHIRSDSKYRIIFNPHRLFTEADNQPAYAYTDEDHDTNIIWVRSQAEMESGRFEVVK